MKPVLQLAFLILPFMAIAQKEIPLYTQNIPNNIPCDKKENQINGTRVDSVTVPTLTIFLPDNCDSFKTAIIICPGGGYAGLAIGHEGFDVARELNKAGIAAFVLKYRLPNDACMENKSIVPLQDAQRAIQLVREKANEWNINENKVGVMGFSAGGHLASTLATHFNNAVIANSKNISLRPDFAILVYPVISFADSLTHWGSRNNLVGKNPTAGQIIFFSNELQITPQTPPTFLVHAADDKTVKVENSLYFFQNLKKNKVPAEMHIYEKGGHGFGMYNRTTKELWLPTAINWMQSNQLIKGK